MGNRNSDRHFGDHIRQLIHDVGHTPSSAAHRTGIPKSTLQDILKSKDVHGSVDSLSKLAELFRLSLSDLTCFNYKQTKHKESLSLVIIDDNRTSRSVSVLVAQNTFSKVFIYDTDNGESALNWFETNTCDLILVDYNMPNMNGIEFAKLYRAIELDNDMPIYIITATAITNYIPKIELKEAKITAVIEKPLTAEKLKSLLASG